MSTNSSPAHESYPPSGELERSGSDSSILSRGDESSTSMSSESSHDEETYAQQAVESDLATPTSPKDIKPFTMAARVDTEDTLRGPLCRSQTFGTLSPSSTMKLTTTTGSDLKKTITTLVTPVTTKNPSTPPKPRTKFQGVTATLRTLYYDYWLQFSMIGLALLGLVTALAHHLYNHSMNGKEIVGDPEWPPRYGNALAFFVKAMLIASVQIAYKQQAWVSL